MCPHGALLRDVVGCRMLQAKRELKLDGTVAVDMREVSGSPLHNQKRAPIDDMNVARPYFRRVDDVKYCVITDIHGDKTSHFCGAFKTAVLKPPAQHGGDVTDAAASNTVGAPCVCSSAVRPATARDSGAVGHIQTATSYVQSLRESQSRSFL